MRALALVGVLALPASPLIACEPAEIDVRAMASVRDVLGEVESVRFDGIVMRDFRIVRRWTATVRPVSTLRGTESAERFIYRFDDERPGCGWRDFQVRRGSQAVFFFEPASRSPYWALARSDYRLARP